MRAIGLADVVHDQSLALESSGRADTVPTMLNRIDM
jgi:hypothetical protein